MITFSGVHITTEFGAPTVRDMAVQGSRICRFAGAYERHFWPVTLHSMLVADLLPSHLEHHALLHDVAAEIMVSDIPKPMKVFEQRMLEKKLMKRTYKQLGLELPTEEEDELIHEADMKAVNAEGTLGCGPRGYVQTQTQYSLDSTAAKHLSDYVRIFTVAEMLDADGAVPKLFEERLLDAIRNAHQAANTNVNYHEAA